MSNHFLLEYLPSFYKRFLIDDNGDNLLNPLFDVFTNYIGDTIYTLQQYAQLCSLDKCPLYFEETYCILDLTNTYKNGYLIDNDVISIDNLYFDANFTIKVNSIYSLNYDVTDNKKYITFSNLNTDVTNLYIKSLKKRNNVINTFYGKLLNYNINIPYNITYDDYITTTQDYKNQLLAILHLRTCGPSLTNIENTIHILCGGKFSPCTGRVLYSTNSKIVIEDSITTKQYTITDTSLTIFSINTMLNRFDSISERVFSIYTLKTTPIKFIQFLLSNYSENMINSLKIDTINKENYGFLKFDTNLNFDSNLFWDMGNGTGFDYSTIPGGTTLINWNDNVTNFKSWIDTRFESLPIYEMFKNILVIDFNVDNMDIINSILKILDDLIPVYVRLMYQVKPTVPN